MNISSFIDHTILRTDARITEVEKYCEEAIAYKFFSVCVNPYYVGLVCKRLEGSGVKTCSVVGFPLGMNGKVKADEALWAIDQGADEIDMVLNVAALKDKNYNEVAYDIEMVRCATIGSTLKVILETCLLEQEEKIVACQICAKADVDFVKTSTGFASGGATLDDIRLMRSLVGSMGVKASGGIKTREDALAMIEAGATRIGTSCGVQIIQGKKISGY